MTTAKNVSVEQVRDIPVEQLFVSPEETRKTIDPGALDELRKSIAKDGVIEALLVRQNPEFNQGYDRDGFEIIAGQRRWLASKLAGKATCPCIVRDLNDEEAARQRIVSNLQRKDLPALEEAAGFGKLLDRLHSVEAVAAEVGKEQAYVAKRLKLRALTLCAADCVREQLITIDHAMLLCRLAEDEQNAALKWCLDPQAGAKKQLDDVIAERLAKRAPQLDAEGGDDEEEAGQRPRWRNTWEPRTVQQLKDHIETSSGTPLDRAPWPMDEDWLLPDVPSCLGCEKNTKANAPLFGDLDTGVAVCTDGSCFKDKTEAFVLYQIDSAKKVGVSIPVLRVSWKETSKAPRMERSDPGANITPDVPKLEQTFKAGQWVEARKKCEHARPAVTVDYCAPQHFGPGKHGLRKPGEILQVCVQPKCKTHPKAYERTAAAGRQDKSEAERKEAAARMAAEFEAFKKAEKPVREALYEAIAAAIKPETLKRNLLKLALNWQAQGGVCRAAGFEGDYEGQQKYFQQRVEQTPAAHLDSLLFDATFGQLLIIDGNAPRAKDRGRSRLRDLAKVVGVDAAAIERKFAQPAKTTAAKGAPKTPAKKAAKAPAKKAAKKGGRK